MPANYTKHHMIHAVRNKGVPYLGVTVVNFVLGQSLIILFTGVLDWNPFLGQFLAVSISAIPAYFMYRAWVWTASGKERFKTEIIPFWLFNLAGLLLTLLFTWPAKNTSIPFAYNIASIVAFGFLWVLKFFFLDALLFREHDAAFDPGADPAI